MSKPSTKSNEQFKSVAAAQIYDRFSSLYFDERLVERFDPSSHASFQAPDIIEAAIIQASKESNVLFTRDAINAARALAAAGVFLDVPKALHAAADLPEWAPMFPDFPSQVIDMDEWEYRKHQLLHYASTYGAAIEELESKGELATAESVAKLADEGFNPTPYLPQVEATEKTVAAETIVAPKRLSICLSPSLMNELFSVCRREFSASGVMGLGDILGKMLSRKERLTESDEALLRSPLPFPFAEYCEPIPFKENIGVVFDEVFSRSVAEASAAAAVGSPLKGAADDFVAGVKGFVLHSGDALEAIEAHINGLSPAGRIYAKDRNAHARRLSTGAKRRFVRLLESYSVGDFTENIAERRGMALPVLSSLSCMDFAKSEPHREAVRALRAGKLETWNARLERVWTEEGAHAALTVCAERPGVLLRSVGRFVRQGVSGEEIFDAFSQGGFDKLSTSTLIAVAAKMSSEKVVLERVVKRAEKKKAELSKEANKTVESLLTGEEEFEKAYKVGGTTFECWMDDFSAALDERRKQTEKMSGAQLAKNLMPVEVAKRQKEAETIVGIVKKLLVKRLSFVTTPFAGKKVFVDDSGYDLDVSLVTSNAGASLSNAVAPGLAKRLPDEAKTVRMFVFWDDEKRRFSDLDLHCYAKRVNEEGEQETLNIGWDGFYNEAGITTSGDITTADKSVEYIDVEIEEAKKNGVSLIDTVVDYFNGMEGIGFSELETAFTGALVLGEDAAVSTSEGNSLPVEAEITAVGGYAFDDGITCLGNYAVRQSTEEEKLKEVRKKKQDVALACGENVLLRSDLRGSKDEKLTLLRLDLEKRCLVSILGGAVVEDSAFSANLLLDALFEAQGAKRVENLEDADIVASVEPEHGDAASGAFGPVNEKEIVPLVENKWFCL